MEEIKENIMELLDNSVGNMSQLDYKDLLEEIISDLEMRLEAVESELEDQE